MASSSSSCGLIRREEEEKEKNIFTPGHYEPRQLLQSYLFSFFFFSFFYFFLVFFKSLQKAMVYVPTWMWSVKFKLSFSCAGEILLFKLSSGNEATIYRLGSAGHADVTLLTTTKWTLRHARPISEQHFSLLSGNDAFKSETDCDVVQEPHSRWSWARAELTQFLIVHRHIFVVF